MASEPSRQTTAPVYELGRRIVVWGMTGSGKTTLANLLGGMLGLGVIDLDAIRHERGWDSVGWDEFRERLMQTLDGYPQGWAIAGSYSHIFDAYLPRADTLIWLHLPWRVSFWRLFWRTVRRAWDRKPLYNENGPLESLRGSFFSPDSVLWYSIYHHIPGTRSAGQRIAGLPDSVRKFELRSAREVEALIQSAHRQAASEVPAG